MSLATLLATVIPASASVSSREQNQSSVAPIDPNVLDALETSDEVNVIVNLKDFESEELASSEKQKELSQDQVQIIEDADLSKSKTTSYDRIPAISTRVDVAQLEALQADPSVESISISNYYSPMALSSERPAYSLPSLNDAVELIDADLAWADSPSRTGDGKKIVIVDTGVDAAHPFLDGAVVTQLCFAEGPNGPGGAGSCPNGLDSQTGTGAGVHCTTNSSCGHGTHVAGIAAGRRSVSGAPVGGIAPDADIIAIQVFSTFTNSNLNYQNDPMCTSVGASSPCILTSDSDVLDALDYVLANRTNVASVNLSLGGGLYSSTCDVYSPFQASTISQLRTHGIITVVASGNDGNTSNIAWPACISGAVAVGATTKAGSVASYSNSNSQIDFWATGSSITSSLPTSPDIYDGSANSNASEYGIKSGTSMATPMISGAIAVLRQAYPGETANQILARLENSGIDITDARNSVTRPRPSVSGALDVSTPAYTELVRTVANKTVYLLNGSSKHAIGSLELFLSFLPIGPLRYVDQNYIDGFTTESPLTPVVGSTADSNVYLILNSARMQFPSCEVVEDYGYSCTGLLELPPEQLSKFAAGSEVNQLAKSSNSPAVYYMNDGEKGRIASWFDLLGLGIGTGITPVSESLLGSVPTGDIVVTGGTLVKTPNSVKIYAINNWSDTPSVFQVSSFQHTIDLGLGADFKIISNAQLSKYTIGAPLKTTVKCGSNTYVGSNGLLYLVDPSLYTHFGYSAGTFQTGGQICDRFNISPTQMTRFVKNGVSIYYMENGTKRKFASYAAYVANGGLSATVITVSTSYINTLPTGTPIYN